MSVGVSSPALDASAVCLPSLCLIHCLALPLLTAVLPVAGVLYEAEWIHRLLVLLALPVSGLVISKSIRTGQGSFFVFGAVLGLALLLSAAFIESLHNVETTLTVAGASILAVAHGYRFANHSH